MVDGCDSELEKDALCGYALDPLVSLNALVYEL